MTNAQAIALPTNAIVRHKAGKLYRVYRVAAQSVIHSAAGVRFDANPYRVAYLGVVGQRDGADFGPMRTLKASDCTLVTPAAQLAEALRACTGAVAVTVTDGAVVAKAVR
jgi:hypothetical protein